MRVPALVKLSSSKNCLVHVSASLLCSLRVSERTSELIVAKVLCDGKSFFFSLVPSIGSNASDEIRLNGLYASKLALSDAEPVLVELVNDSPVCISAWIEPVTVDDWEILELHAGEVENQLLDQIRVIWAGQVFPLWVDQNVCIYMKTVKTEPPSQCCILIPLSQLFIEPKVDRSAVETSPEQHKSIPHAVADSVGAVAESDADPHKIDASHKPANQVRFEFLCRIIKAVKFILHYIWKRLLPSFYEKLKFVFFPSGDNKPLVEYSSSSARRDTMMKLIDQLPGNFDVVMRVKPVSADSTRWYEQPSTIFLLSFEGGEQEQQDNLLPVLHLVKVSKVSSPREKIEQDIKASKQAKASDGGNSAIDFVGTGGVHGGDFVVRMYVHPSSKFAMTCDLTSLHSLSMPTCLRRQLRVGVSSKIRVRKLSTLPKVCDDVQSITLSILSSPTKLREADGGKLASAFGDWLDSVSDLDNPLPISIGTLLLFPVKCETDAESGSCDMLEVIVSDVRTKDSERPDLPDKESDSKTYLLTCDDLHNLEIVFKRTPDKIHVPQTTELDFEIPAESIVLHCDGLESEVDAITRFVEVALLSRPIPAALAKRGLHATSVLVTGQKGMGKTTLCRAVQREFGVDPRLHSYTAYVACGQLRGKKTENVRRKLEILLSELLWRQPSVLLLDDLDQLIPAAGSLEEDRSPDAIYTLQLASVMQNFFKSLTRGTSSVVPRIAIIATAESKSSIHPSLTSSSNHFFTTAFNLDLPDSSQRLKMLKSVIERFTDFSIPDDLDNVVEKTEGFAIVDLVSIVRRSAHLVAQRRMNETGDSELMADDLLDALCDFTPVSLRNTNLHKPAPLTWQHVGGLQSVKQKLMEQLIWPLKYRRVFEQCGLKAQSGILLFGPPGCGKTLIAGVVANECDLNFITVKGPELLSKYIGASEAAVRELFSRAKAAAPCILFFDEFDSLAPPRGHDSTGVTDRVVNQLLTHLDGVEPLVGVTVVAASSRPDLLDAALLRPGRLDNLLYCPLPTESERLEILRCLSSGLPIHGDVNLQEIAVQCENYSGADLKALLYNAQLAAIHDLCGFSQATEKLNLPNGSVTPKRELYSSLSSLSLISASSLGLEVDDSYQSIGPTPAVEANQSVSLSFSTASVVNVESSATSLMERIDHVDDKDPLNSDLHCEVNNYQICFDDTIGLCAPASSSSTLNPDPVAPDIVYYPSMHHGPSASIPQPVHHAVQTVCQSLTDSQQSNVIAESTAPKSDLLIEPRHIQSALSSTRPSLTAHDRAKFEDLYASFIRSRDKSDMNKPNYYSGKQRATLS